MSGNSSKSRANALIHILRVKKQKQAAAAAAPREIGFHIRGPSQMRFTFAFIGSSYPQKIVSFWWIFVNSNT